MSDVTFTAGDTSPSLFGTLTINGEVLDLTGATVKFQMRFANDGRYVVNADAVVVTAAAGAVRYDWAEGDLAQPGEFASRWQITYSDLTVQHSEPENTITVDRA